MQLSNPPIGLTAVEQFYSPLELTEFAAPCGTRIFHITSHVKAAPNIKVFFQEVNARGLAGLVHTFDGCYVDRVKRLSNQLSMHGRGAAFDINAGSNPQGDRPTMPAALIALGRELGFFWGGDFTGRYVDGMHFQLGTDFALNGRPVPRVTWKPEGAGLPEPAPTPAVPEASEVKIFLPTGETAYFSPAKHSYQNEGGVLVVKQLA